jgi:hypothetical protein
MLVTTSSSEAVSTGNAATGLRRQLAEGYDTDSLRGTVIAERKRMCWKVGVTTTGPQCSNEPTLVNNIHFHSLQIAGLDQVEVR